MDETKLLSEMMNDLMEKAEKLPSEKQLRLMWVMLGAMANSLEQFKAYQNAGYEALAKYIETCGEIEEKTLQDQKAIAEKLVLNLIDFVEEMFNE